MNIDVVTFGKAMRDIILDTPDDISLDNDQEKIVVEQAHLDIGGGAINTAVGLVKLGVEAAPAAVIGEDAEGKEIKERLERRSVSSEFIVSNDSLSTGISVIVEGKDRKHLAYVYPGVNHLLDLDMIRWKLALKAKYWYLLSVGNPDVELLNKIAQRKQRSGVRLAFNPGRLQLDLGLEKLKQILQATDILLVNQSEAERLSGKKDDQVFKALVGYGPKIVVVTRGKEGAAAYGGKEIITTSPYPSKKINALGAGDAFGSGFIACFSKTGDIEESLKWGIINSASVIREYGAQSGLLTKGEIIKKVKEDKVKITKAGA
jgi:sugar/nucleoside kinase (ribokinase family)